MVVNHQFPHTCIVYNTVTTGEYPNETTSLNAWLASECQNQVNGDTSLSNSTYKSEYVCYMPKQWKYMKNGNIIKVRDGVREITGNIIAFMYLSMGMQVWYNKTEELNGSETAQVFNDIFDEKFK